MISTPPDPAPPVAPAWDPPIRGLLVESVGNHADEDDEMGGAIDLNDVDWASSDMDVGSEDAGLGGGSISLSLTDESPQVAKLVGGQDRLGAEEGDTSSAPRNNGGVSPPPGSSSTADSVPSRGSSPSPTNSVPTTRASRAQRTSPFNLKACSSCKKGKAQAIKCRVDRRHWEDPDWTDPPTRPWLMPAGFVEWLAVEERQAQQQPGDAKFLLRGVAADAARKLALDAAASEAAALAAANKAKVRQAAGAGGVGASIASVTATAAAAPKNSGWTRVVAMQKAGGGSKAVTGVVAKSAAAVAAKAVAEPFPRSSAPSVSKPTIVVASKPPIIAAPKSMISAHRTVPVAAAKFVPTGGAKAVAGTVPRSEAVTTVRPDMSAAAKGGAVTPSSKASARGGGHDGTKGAGPRASRGESASALLERMLGSASLPPPPAPAPAARPVIPAPVVAPGAPVMGGLGIKRTRCLAAGCSNPVPSNVAFCSDDCLVAAQKQVVQALAALRRRRHRPSKSSAPWAGSMMAGGSMGKDSARANNGSVGSAPSWRVEGGGGGAEVAAAGGGGGKEVKSEGGGGVHRRGGGGDRPGRVGGPEGAAGGNGGGGAAKPAGGEPSSKPDPPWTEQDEEEFAKGLEAVRGRVVLTAAQKYRLKIRDRFRDLFAEGMAELGVDRSEIMMAGVLAWDLEHELHVFSGADRGAYKEKATSLIFNIKFAKNPELFKVGGSGCCIGPRAVLGVDGVRGAYVDTCS